VIQYCTDASEPRADVAALPGELKQVTVLFCDIVESTPLTERLGPEAMRDLVASFLETSLAEVRRNAGIAPQFLGDGFMALFGAPLAQEDHVQRALLAALAIQRTLRAGADRTHPPVRIGIHTGPVVFGPVDSGLEIPTTIGDTANVAARLQQAAKPGDILLSDVTYELARTYARVELVGPVTFKGKPTPILAYRLLDISERRSRFHQNEVDWEARAEQRPAAYRFGLRQDRVDVLPERFDTIDVAFAIETYEELGAKARALHERLKQTNSAQRVLRDVDRLLDSLGTTLEDVRPGVLLSRSRSIEAHRTAFEDELFPDAIAMIDDALHSLRDLLAVFPIVRRIEVERLALDLDRSADKIAGIREEMDAVNAAAAKSEAATEEAVAALSQNEAAIEEASDPVLRTSLVADQLLVLRNFGSAVAGGLANLRTELGDVSGKSWEAIKTELPKGVGAAARVAPMVALGVLAVYIAGPLAAISAAVPVFKPLANAIKRLTKEQKSGRTEHQGERRKHK
jgi:class 3 adenylate cyclase